jgi:DNA-binding beta-propeller fold protein YncE
MAVRWFAGLTLSAGLVATIPTPLSADRPIQPNQHTLDGAVAVLWQTTSPGWSRYAVLSPDGSVLFLAGVLDSQFLTQGLDAITGNRIWEARYKGPSTCEGASCYGDFPRDIGVSADGSTVFVTGSSGGAERGFDIATLAYHAFSGEQLWVNRVVGPDHADEPFALAVSPDSSKMFVTGKSWQPPRQIPALQSVTIAYAAATGDDLWMARFEDPDFGGNRARAIGVSPDGTHVYVAGHGIRLARPRDAGYLTLAYDAESGQQLWQADAGRLGWAYSLAVSADGERLLVTGEDGTVAFDAVTGRELWVAKQGARGEFVVTSTTSERAFVSLGERYIGRPKFLTSALDQLSGMSVWSSTYNASESSHDVAMSLSSSTDGNMVYTTGWSQPSYDEIRLRDAVTLAYNSATGEERWLARYDSGQYDSGEAVTAHGDGDCVFISVTSWDFDTQESHTMVLAYTSNPSLLIKKLSADLGNLPAPPGLARALFGKLRAASGILDSGRNANDHAAIGPLRAFIHAVEAQAGKRIAEADAEQLIAMAEDAIRLIAGR